MNKCNICGEYTHGDNLICDECRQEMQSENDQERREFDLAEQAAECTCGAWKWKDGVPIRKGDCVCS